MPYFIVKHTVFTKQFEDSNNRDICKIWKWEISKKVTKFLLYNILLFTFEVLIVVYMKNMVFCNVTSCSLTSTKLHGITPQETNLLLFTGFYTYLLTYSMEQSSSWEAHRFSASREITHVVWDLKVHYHVYKCRPPFPILSMPLHPTFWRCIIILSSHLCLGLPSCLFPSGPPTKTLYTPLLSPILATYPAHLILLDLIIQIIFTVWFSLLPCYLIPLRPKYSPQHTILKHPQPTFLPRYGQPHFTPTQNNR